MGDFLGRFSFVVITIQKCILFLKLAFLTFLYSNMRRLVALRIVALILTQYTQISFDLLKTPTAQHICKIIIAFLFLF